MGGDCRRVWSAGVLRRPTKANTGTTRRAPHLPVVNHEIVATMKRSATSRGDNDDDDDRDENVEPEPFSSPSRCCANDCFSSSSERTATSRCVYNYGDKYRFSRVIGEHDLVFDSHFESGNLLCARRASFVENNAESPYATSVANGDLRQEYDLEVHHDLHSVGHAQWFYFSCSNTRAGVIVRFNLTNFAKTDSLFNHGMRPLLFSTIAAKNGVGWRRAGRDVRYHPTNNNGKGRANNSNNNGTKKRLYTLTFEHRFEFSSDRCFFAYAYPYTYTALQRRLTELQTDPRRRRTFRRRALCRTLSGNDCDVLTITEPTKDLDALNRRRGVILTARVHPGESNASWVCDGMLGFLTGPTKEARRLRRDFVFKVVPMLNPDGVVNGNYRTSMAGVDLNRRWDAPDPAWHPTVYHTKRMVERFQRCRDVLTVCDVHGHSRKEGVFVYGCDFGGGKSGAVTTRNHNHNHKNGGGVDRSALLLPTILDRDNDFFKLSSCNFKTLNCKAPTMRVVMFKELGIQLSYSMEASLGGANKKHFTQEDYKHVGRRFCRALLELSTLTKRDDGGEIETRGIDRCSPFSRPYKTAVIRVGGERETRRSETSTTTTTKTTSLSRRQNNAIDGEDGASSDDSDPNASDDNLTREEIARLLPRRNGGGVVGTSGGVGRVAARRVRRRRSKRSKKSKTSKVAGKKKKRSDNASTIGGGAMVADRKTSASNVIRTARESKSSSIVRVQKDNRLLEEMITIGVRPPIVNRHQRIVIDQEISPDPIVQR